MTQSQLPEWIQYIQAVGPSFVAVVAALIAGYIAWRQWRTAQDKLRFDLWDRRNAIYRSVKEILAQTLRDGRIDFKDNVAFLQKTAGADFLFDKPVKEYLTQIYRTLVDLEYHQEEMSHSPPSPDRHEHVQKSREIKRWLAGELSEGAEKVFAPYLDFGHLKKTRK